MQTGQPGDRACGDHQQNTRANLMQLRARPCIETRALHFHCKLRVCGAGTNGTGQGSHRATRSRPGGHGRAGVREGLTSQAQAAQVRP